MSSINWLCPHCEHHVLITSELASTNIHVLKIGNKLGEIFATTAFRVCPNAKCNNPTLYVTLNRHEKMMDGNYIPAKVFINERLMPRGNAKNFPDYVPAVIIEDYREASEILQLSPKASATLSRRCLQGILRDFWKVKPGNLINEIDQIQDKIDPVTWEAIDSVRRIGNIGAHMEKSIDTIVEVDAGEAEVLVELIETLIAEWYIARAVRQERMAAIKAIAAAKGAPGREHPEKAGPT